MKRSLLITLVALAIAVPAALASGGEGTRIALNPVKAFPAAKGSAKFKAKPGERELQVEVEHIRRLAGRRVVVVVGGAKLGTAKVSAPRRGPAEPQQRAGPTRPSGLCWDDGEGAHRWRNDSRQGIVLAGSGGGRSGSTRSAATPSDRALITKSLHLELVLERRKSSLAIGMAQGSFRTVIIHTRAFGVALGLVLLVAASIGATSVQAAARHVSYGKPGKVETPKIQGSHTNAVDKPLVIVPKHGLWRSPVKAGVGKRQKVCNQMQIRTQVGSPPTSWSIKATSKNYCGWVKPNERAQMGEWSWVGEVATPYHVEFVVTWATQKRKLAKATYDYNFAGDYKCLTLFCLVDTDPTTNFPYVSFN